MKMSEEKPEAAPKKPRLKGFAKIIGGLVDRLVRLTRRQSATCIHNSANYLSSTQVQGFPGLKP